MTVSKVYPYSSPIIMTDAIFVMYGGHTGSTTAAQRQAAYLMAEQFATNDLGTFLLPTTVTGTYQPTMLGSLRLDHSYVQKVNVVTYKDFEGDTVFSFTGTPNQYGNLIEPEYGIMQLNSFPCGGCHRVGAYNIFVSYTAGLPTGVANTPTVLMALATASDLMLNEIVGYGNEAPGDAGLKQFSNQEYSETRFGLVNTSFGSSPRANMAHKLLNGLRRNRWVGI